jgi:AcrR family transcriptional regulator
VAQSCHQLPKTRAYHSELREAHADATRERIVDSAYKLLKTTRPVDLSYADVADDAGVSVRTVYRAFPRPEDLFMAVSSKLFAAVFPGKSTPTADTIDELVEALRKQFQMLDEDPALFRVIFAVPTRSRMDPDNMFERFFGHEVEQLTPTERRTVFALIDLLGSPYAWDVMHHNWNVPADRAVRGVLVAIRALLDYLHRAPDALAAKTPAPTIAPRRKR